MIPRRPHWCLFIFLLIISDPSFASHLRAAEIQVNRKECTSLTVEIIITAYLNAYSNVLFGGENDYLYFGDGSRQLVPETPSEIINAELGVSRVRFITTHTYAVPGSYTISYNESNRNAGILNFESVNTRFHTETRILLAPDLCNSSPTLLIPPVDRACSGVQFFHNPGATDADGDSLSYELVVPQKDAGVSVTDYFSPDDPRFYSGGGISFEEGNEEKDGPPHIMIAGDGMIRWDAPGVPGEYGLAIKVIEWKFSAAERSWYQAGYVIRDMQIIVEDCVNRKPEMNVPEDFCVTAGTTIQFDIPAKDADHNDVVIEAFSEVFLLPEDAAELQPADGAIQSTTPPHDTASVHFVWHTTCTQVRDQPYKVIFKVSDRPPSGPRLVQFYTVNIKVIAPAPEYEKVSVNPVTKTVTLQWGDYPCTNVRTFQVWRRISELSYEPPECNNGLPEVLRYQLMAEIPANEFYFTDKNLVFGAAYCYRIIAVIGEARTSSRISIDTCLIPKPADAPVIANVTVETTDQQEGAVLIRWTRPFDIDPQQYPPPYYYKVLRKIETDQQSSYQPITVETMSDTVYTDSQLNTKENVYQYQIELYVPSLISSPVDTSSQASSVFARAQPVINGIAIRWEANTPWYNYAQSHPYHLIYRSDSPSGPFELTDSVNVLENDFQYTDRGVYKNLGLTGNMYFYKVKTRGTYGNRKIVSPLENFSQVATGHVLDTIPPCRPNPEIVNINCVEFPCDGTEYYTKIVWQKAESACDLDVAAYEILLRPEGSNVYTPLATVSTNEFIHTGLNSLNQCYRLISIDKAGNRSDTSATVCSSNCLNFKLPNVITPGVKDNRNDVLTTYAQHDPSGENCSRSVQRVDIRIYSRWGKEIFTTTLTQEDTPVFWNGRTSDGTEAAPGVYYYHAQVIFDTNDPSARKQQFKGWVHLVR